MNKEPKIKFVDKSTDFVGFESNENGIEISVPQVFRKEENYKSDLLLFLNSISLAKTIDKNKLKKGNKENEIWPLDSYLWMINDYLENGFYYNREKVYSNSYSGKIEWKKTLKNLPIYSNGNIIYDKLVTSKMSASNDMIAQIYKLCLKQSINRIGWLYNYNLYVEVQQLVSVAEMVSIIRKELVNMFDDIKRLRFNHMLKILNVVNGDSVVSNSNTYGIKNYYYVFETMVDMLFDGIKDNKKKYNPDGYWNINNRDTIASSLRPDTILKKDGATYILDAKMYQYGVSHNRKDLPETQSIEKQITYGDYVHNNIGDKVVRNAFILPYNKDLDVFKNDSSITKYNDGNLAYFGYAHVDWRNEDDFRDYDHVYAYGVDFNYLLRNYKRADTDMINSLCDSIEDKLKIDRGNA